MKWPFIRRSDYDKLAKANVELSREIAAKESERVIYRHLVRQMDQDLFQMSQCTSWEQMRPIFLELFKGTQHRMKQESDRIRNLVAKEIYETNEDFAPQVREIEYKP